MRSWSMSVKRALVEGLNGDHDGASGAYRESSVQLTMSYANYLHHSDDRALLHAVPVPTPVSYRVQQYRRTITGGRRPRAMFALPDHMQDGHAVSIGRGSNDGDQLAYRSARRPLGV